MNYQICFDILAKENLMDPTHLSSIETHVDPVGILSAIACLHRAKILTQFNLELLIAQAHPQTLASALSFLERNKLLTDENTISLTRVSNPYTLARLISFLQKAGILTPENRDLVTAHKNHELLASALTELMRQGRLNLENFEVIVRHDQASVDLVKHALWCFEHLKQKNNYFFTLILEHIQPLKFVNAINELIEREILNPETLHAIVTHARPDSMIKALVSLKKIGKLKTKYINMVEKHENPDLLAAAILQLIDNITLRKAIHFVKSHKNPLDLANAFCKLEEMKLFNPEYQELVSAHPQPFDLVKAFDHLKRTGLFNEKNKLLLISSMNPYNLAQGLMIFIKEKLLTPENTSFLTSVENPLPLANSFVLLHRNSLLIPEYKTLLLASKKPENLAEGFLVLCRNSLLTEQNIKRLRRHRDPKLLADAIILLTHKELMTESNFDLIKGHPELFNVVNALIYLNHQRLNQELFDFIIQSKSPLYMGLAMKWLGEYRILTKENCLALSTQNNLNSVTDAMSYLIRSQIFNQANFETLLSPDHASLIHPEIVNEIFKKLPISLLNRITFPMLVLAAEAPNPFEQLKLTTKKIFSNPILITFNPQQSTHTNTVHRSISASALKLMERYGKDLNFQEKKIKISRFINILKNNQPKNGAIKRCYKRITSETNKYTDASGITLLQIVVLAYEAIHDDSKRMGSLKDAKSHFTEALYEIQRGYNIDAGQGPEDGRDLPICNGGAFNKILEKLHGIHADVEINFTTKELSITKFPKIAQNYAIEYLNKFLSPKNIHEYQAIKKLLNVLSKDKSLEPIWPKISLDVVQVFWQEFHEVYNNNIHDVNFRGIIENGSYINFSEKFNFDDMLDKLRQSPGYREYIEVSKSQLGISRFGLFIDPEETYIESDRPSKKGCFTWTEV